MVYNVVRILCILILKIFYRIKIVHYENVPSTGGIIVCSNHSSNLDPIILGTTLKRPCNFMAKKELFDTNIKNSIMCTMNAYPVNREISDMAAYKETLKRLKDGKVIGVFAQGTRSDTVNVKEGKSGVSLFAMKGNVPVVPIGISGNYKKLFSKIVVNIGAPMTLDEYRGQKVKTELLDEVTEKIMIEIESLVNEKS